MVNIYSICNINIIIRFFFFTVCWHPFHRHLLDSLSWTSIPPKVPQIPLTFPHDTPEQFTRSSSRSNTERSASSVRNSSPGDTRSTTLAKMSFLPPRAAVHRLRQMTQRNKSPLVSIICVLWTTVFSPHTRTSIRVPHEWSCTCSGRSSCCPPHWTLIGQEEKLFPSPAQKGFRQGLILDIK